MATKKLAQLAPTAKYIVEGQQWKQPKNQAKVATKHRKEAKKMSTDPPRGLIEPTYYPPAPAPLLTPEQSVRAINILQSAHINGSCSFMSDRDAYSRRKGERFGDRGCAEQNSLDFDCMYCAAEKLLTEIGKLPRRR
jgi:hypothetical protein